MTTSSVMVLGPGLRASRLVALSASGQAPLTGLARTRAAFARELGEAAGPVSAKPGARPRGADGLPLAGLSLTLHAFRAQLGEETEDQGTASQMARFLARPRGADGKPLTGLALTRAIFSSQIE